MALNSNVKSKLSVKEALKAVKLKLIIKPLKFNEDLRQRKALSLLFIVIIAMIFWLCYLLIYLNKSTGIFNSLKKKILLEKVFAEGKYLNSARPMGKAKGCQNKRQFLFNLTTFGTNITFLNKGEK